MQWRRVISNSQRPSAKSMTKASCYVRLTLWAVTVSPVIQATAKTPEEILRDLSPSIVIVDAANQNEKLNAFGSGVVVSLGKVITKCNVIEEAERIDVRQGTRVLPARLSLKDAKQRLCELDVPGLVAPPAAIARDGKPNPGARVYAIGAPQGLELNISEGLILAIREIDDYNIFQSSAPISPGSSGGGLFDSDGRLVGILSFYRKDGQNSNLAYSTDWIVRTADARRIMYDLLRDDTSSRANYDANLVRDQEDKRKELIERALAMLFAKDMSITVTKETAEGSRREAEAAQRRRDEYIGKIKAKIEQNTFAPEGLTGNPRAEFKIVLLPTGEVLSATLLKSSGNPAYDEAVERSIYKSVPLPLPPNNPELFREFRELRLPFTYVRR